MAIGVADIRLPLHLDELLMRVCSLLPGATEVVAALGMADSLIGISHECDFPSDVPGKPVLVQGAIPSDRLTSQEIDSHVKEKLGEGSRLYTLDEELFLHLEPEVVISQDLCQVCAITPHQLQRIVDALPHPPTLLTLNPTTLDHVLDDVARIGNAIGVPDRADRYRETLRTRLHATQREVPSLAERPRVACLEWLDPLYVAGHWIPEMVNIAGGVDPLGQPGEPSRGVTWDEVAAAEPDVVVLMPCGFSSGRTVTEMERLTSRYAWHVLPAAQNGRVYAVDASAYFSRPGPRLVDGVAILASLCHPTLFQQTPPGAVQRIDIKGPPAGSP